MSSTFDNCMKWYWPTLCCGALHCIVITNVLPHWLVTGTLQCPLQHKLFGYEGIISDILISVKPPFQEHWNDTSKHSPFTVLMNYLMFKVTNVYVCMYIYKSEYTWLWSKEINVKDFPVLPPIFYCEYQFCFHNMYFTLSNMFQQGEFQLLLMKPLFTWTHIQQMVMYLCNGKNSAIYWFYTSKDIWVE